ncbi:hypothetical protein MKW94_017601 [Papaver nudicaule]|uniref:GIR1-like zinc ribbon domain-containing protein n=1 Tax=Papaver nudicaule TaxID=74823 RepID=A0AA41S4Q6_PAPNU|nr:hypothetical protein [Papaver nudicaule]
MASITASLELSFQNCSLSDGDDDNDSGIGFSASSDDMPQNHTNSSGSLELNSHVSLPYQWEQCLDLKTGEIYYINWMNGRKVKEDPRKMFNGGNGSEQLFHYHTDNDNDEDSSCDSDEGSSSPCSSTTTDNSKTNGYYTSNNDHHHQADGDDDGDDEDQVLVVAGCKSCLMYFMLPKRVEECPKCNALLLHFDHRSDQNSIIVDSP